MLLCAVTCRSRPCDQWSAAQTPPQWSSSMVSSSTTRGMGINQFLLSPVRSHQWFEQLYSSGYPHILGLVSGLVGPVSESCFWVRWQAWFVSSISVWQCINAHAYVPVRYTVYCWDAKQPRNKQVAQNQESISSLSHKVQIKINNL